MGWALAGSILCAVACGGLDRGRAQVANPCEQAPAVADGECASPEEWALVEDLEGDQTVLRGTCRLVLQARGAGRRAEVTRALPVPVESLEVNLRVRFDALQAPDEVASPASGAVIGLAWDGRALDLAVTAAGVFAPGPDGPELALPGTVVMGASHDVWFALHDAGLEAQLDRQRVPIGGLAAAPPADEPALRLAVQSTGACVRAAFSDIDADVR